MVVIATLLERRSALVAFRRALAPLKHRIIAARSPAHLDTILSQHLIDVLVISASHARGQVLNSLRHNYATLPLLLYSPMRSDDVDLLFRVYRERMVALAIEGVDEPVLATKALSHGVTARRVEALKPLAQSLGLEDPLQQRSWEMLLADAPDGSGTSALAARLKLSRETLSRRFSAGGAPTLKRAMDGVRLYAAGRLMGNTAYGVDDVARLVGFSSVSLLQKTARRTLGVSARDVGGLSDEAWVQGLRGEGGVGDWE